MKYYDELTRAMTRLGERDDVVFMGQAVGYPGTGMTNTFKDVPRAKLLEMPVAEDMQLGMATGMAIAGLLPICVYPRWNFLLLAMSQLVLHLDKLPLMGDYAPRVIIRTAVATDDPLDPGPQHLGDFSRPVSEMLRTIKVIDLAMYRDGMRDIVQTYEAAANCEHSTIIVEHHDLYDKVMR